jgi:hypothetical protein
VGRDTFEAVHSDKRLGIRLGSRFVPGLYHGSERPIAGGVSCTFGVKEPAFTIAARAQVTGSTQFLTEIMPR